jgi:uncharacterized repeat protein (TIGR04052 family)
MQAAAVGACVVACTPSERDVQLRFELSERKQVEHLEFYVHSVTLLTEEGAEQALTLKSDMPWQSERVALIDMTGGGRAFLTGQAPEGRYTGVRFSVGVPFDLNHSNPLSEGAPLDRAEMFWAWQSGYKFLRLDLSPTEHAAAFHLGSTGCSSASALRPPRQPCAQPNVMRIELRGFDPLAQPITIHIGEIASALLPDGRACTGDYAQPGCSVAYSVTGLNWQSGSCMSEQTGAPNSDEGVCSSQRLFAVVPGSK